MAKFQVVPLVTLSSPKGIARSRSRRIPIIPNEVRRKIRHGRFHQSQEPSSPKVLCLGEVKRKQKKEEEDKQNLSKHEGTHIQLPTKDKTTSPCPDRKGKRESLNEKKQKKQEQSFCISKLRVCWFKQKVWGANPCVPELELKPSWPQEDAAAPSLCRTKSFASGRGAMSNFDCKVLDVPRLQKDDRALFFR